MGLWVGGLCDLGDNSLRVYLVTSCLCPFCSNVISDTEVSHCRQLGLSVNCCGFDNGGVRCLIKISCSSAGCHLNFTRFSFLFEFSFVCYPAHLIICRKFFQDVCDPVNIKI